MCDSDDSIASLASFTTSGKPRNPRFLLVPDRPVLATRFTDHEEHRFGSRRSENRDAQSLTARQVEHRRVLHEEGARIDDQIRNEDGHRGLRLKAHILEKAGGDSFGRQGQIFRPSGVSASPETAADRTQEHQHDHANSRKCAGGHNMRTCGPQLNASLSC